MSDQIKLNQIWDLSEKIEDLIKIANADDEISNRVGNEILNLTSQIKQIAVQ